MNQYRIQAKLFNFIVLYKYFEMRFTANSSKKCQERRQSKKIRKLVQYAMQHELYQKKFQEAGIDPKTVRTAADLAKISPLTKQEYRDMISKALENDTTGRYAYCHKDHTSGSTGIPLHTCLTPEEAATVVAQLLFILKQNGYRLFLDSSLDMSSPVHKGTRQAKSMLQRLGLLRKCYVSTMDPPEEIIGAINRFKPTEMLAGKSIMHSVLQYAYDHDIKIYPTKYIVNTAEPMDDSSAYLIEHFFGPNALIDSYASIEAGIIAYTKCGNRHKFYVNPLHYDYSITDENGDPSDNGELRITNLYLHLFPMLNYQQGDRVESVIDENGVRCLTKISGRNDDYISTRDGRKLSFHTLFAFLPKCTFIEQYRVVQEDLDTLIIMLAMRKNEDKDRAEIEREFTENLNLYLGIENMKYIFEWYESIPLDANGKIRVLISKVK